MKDEKIITGSNVTLTNSLNKYQASTKEKTGIFDFGLLLITAEK